MAGRLGHNGGQPSPLPVLLVVCTSQLQALPARVASRPCLIENDIDYCRSIASCIATTSCRAGNPMAVKAMVQLSRRMNRWDIARQLSEAILDHHPEN